MGCDIHIVKEKNVNGKWIGVDSFQYIETFDGAKFPTCRERNYERFAQLASVRGTSERKPKGMPANASELSLLLFDPGDDHSPSYMSIEEASEIFLATERRELRQYARKYPEDFYFKVEKEEMKDYRIVFWFDN